MSTPRVEAISRAQRLAYLDDGSVTRMQHYVDCFGDETDESGEAISAIAPLPDGRWLVIDFSQFETVRLQ